EAVGDLLSPLLGTLERIGWVQRHLHPPVAEQLAEALGPHADHMAEPLHALETAACPDDLRFLRDRLLEVGRQSVGLVSAFVEAARTPGDVLGLYRAMRRFAPVQETLYPLAPALHPVSRWFLEPARRDDQALIERLRDAARRGNDVEA